MLTNKLSCQTGENYLYGMRCTYCDFSLIREMCACVCDSYSHCINSYVTLLFSV